MKRLLKMRRWQASGAKTSDRGPTAVSPAPSQQWSSSLGATVDRSRAARPSRRPVRGELFDDTPQSCRASPERRNLRTSRRRRRHRPTPLPLVSLPPLQA